MADEENVLTVSLRVDGSEKYQEELEQASKGSEAFSKILDKLQEKIEETKRTFQTKTDLAQKFLGYGFPASNLSSKYTKQADDIQKQVDALNELYSKVKEIQNISEKIKPTIEFETRNINTYKALTPQEFIDKYNLGEIPLKGAEPTQEIAEEKKEIQELAEKYSELAKRVEKFGQKKKEAFNFKDNSLITTFQIVENGVKSVVKLLNGSVVAITQTEEKVKNYGQLFEGVIDENTIKKQVNDVKNGLKEIETEYEQAGKIIRQKFVEVDGKTFLSSESIKNAKEQIKNYGQLFEGVIDENTIKKRHTDLKTGIEEIVQEYEKGGEKIQRVFNVINGQTFLKDETISKTKERLKNLGVEVDKIKGKIESKVTNFGNNTEKITTANRGFFDRFKGLFSGKETQTTYTRDLDTGKIYKSQEKEVQTQKGLFNWVKKTGKEHSKQFAERAKRIVQYKILSSLIRGIINLFKQGFSLLTDNTVLTESLVSLKAVTLEISTSFASVLTPAIQQLATFLEPLGEQFVLIANKMSQANAIAHGQSEYYKLSSSAIKEYAKSLQEANGQLSQLDKFATLSGSKPMLGSYVSVDESPFEELNEQSEEAQANIEETQKAIEDFIDSLPFLIEFITKIVELGGLILGGFKKVSEWLSSIGIDTEKQIILIASALLALQGPLGIVTAAFLSLMLMFSDAKKSTKLLAAAIITLAVAYAVAAIAKAALEKGAIGAATVAGAIAAAAAIAGGGLIAASANASKAENTSTLNNPSLSKNYGSGTPTSSYSDNGSFVDNMSNANANAYSNTSSDRPIEINLTSNVDLDGKTVGQGITKYVYEEGRRQGYNSF